MSTKFVKVVIQGVSGLLMNRFETGPDGPLGDGGATREVHHGEFGTPREQAEKKAYRNSETKELFVPAANLYASIIGAGIFHKLNNKKVTTQNESLVPAGMWIRELILPLGTKDYEVDSRRAVIPKTGMPYICHRPRLDEWELSFTLEIDTTMFSEKFARALVDDAGKKRGLCDNRPSKKGPYGRFVVTHWEVEKDAV